MSEACESKSTIDSTSNAMRAIRFLIKQTLAYEGLVEAMTCEKERRKSEAFMLIILRDETHSVTGAM